MSRARRTWAKLVSKLESRRWFAPLRQALTSAISLRDYDSRLEPLLYPNHPLCRALARISALSRRSPLRKTASTASPTSPPTPSPTSSWPTQRGPKSTIALCRVTSARASCDAPAADCISPYFQLPDLTPARKSGSWQRVPGHARGFSQISSDE